MSAEVEVAYLDGSTERVKFTASVMVGIERRFKVGVVPPIESGMYGAWLGLRKPGNGTDDDARFDDWLSGVDSVADVQEESADADPTVPGPAPG